MNGLAAEEDDALRSNLAAADGAIARLAAHVEDLHRQFVATTGRPPIPYPGSERPPHRTEAPVDELLHFPDNFPMKALAVLAPVVRDRAVRDRVLAGEAALTLLGFAMGAYLGHDHGPNVVGALPPSSDTDQDSAVAALDELEAAAPGLAASAGVVGAFNWKKFAENAFRIFQFVLPLILMEPEPEGR